jgi:hypothetical protein
MVRSIAGLGRCHNFDFVCRYAFPVEEERQNQMSKQVLLHELEGLCIVSIDGDDGYEEPCIELSDGVTVIIRHSCCGCCDGGYQIEATRDE